MPFPGMTWAESARRRRERWGYSYTVIQAAQAQPFAPLVRQLTGR